MRIIYYLGFVPAQQTKHAIIKPFALAFPVQQFFSCGRVCGTSGDGRSSVRDRRSFNFSRWWAGGHSEGEVIPPKNEDRKSGAAPLHKRLYTSYFTT